MTLPAPPEGMILGVDTGVDQGALIVPQLQAAGADFGIIRCTDGIHDVDPEWAASSAAARAANWPFGAYGVLEPYGLTGVAAQVDNFVKRARGSGARFFCCDFELAMKETGLVALETAADWCDGVEQALSSAVMLYSGPSFMETLEKFAGNGATTQAVLARLAKRFLWVADYREARVAACAPEVPPPFPDWTLWQVGPKGASLPWNSRLAVDVNLFRGTVDDLLALFSGNPPPVATPSCSDS